MIRLALPLLLALSVSTARAQWRPTSGPSGTWLQAIAKRGNELYVSGRDTIAYRSRDEGHSWSPVKIDAELKSFAMVGDVLLAGTDLGIRRLAPGDSLFKRSSSGITESFRVVVAAQGRFAFAGGNWGVRLSLDSGVTWSVPHADIADSISFLAADSVEVVAASYHGRTYRSRDSGVTWTRITDGPTYPNGLLRCQGRTFASSYAAVLRLVEDGSRWDTVFAFAAGYLYGRLFQLGQDLYAGNVDGLHRSRDGGTTWAPISKDLGALQRVSGIVRQGDFLYASTATGVYRSPDSGATWIGINRGLAEGAGRYQLAFQSDTLFAIGGGILRVSIDSGATWFQRSMPSDSLAPMSIAAEPGTLYLGTYHHGVRRSLDGGRTWLPTGTGLPSDKWIEGLFLGGNALFAFVDHEKLFRSTDKGATWKSAEAGLADLAAPQELHALGDTLFLATTAGTYRSIDGGATWLRPGGTAAQDQWVQHLASQGNTLYAFIEDIPEGNSRDGLYFSQDLARNWTRIPMRGLQDTVLNGLVAYGTHLFATTRSGIYHSADSGKTWSAIEEGLRDSRMSFPSLWIHGSTLYANPAGLWTRSLSDFGPLVFLGKREIRKGMRKQQKPNWMRQGGAMTFLHPSKQGAKRVDLSGQSSGLPLESQR